MNENLKDEPSDMPKSVLILTRDAKALNQISKYCMSLGLLTRTANSSIQAANHIDFEIPDLLIVDAEMSAQDGSSFVEFLDSRSPEYRMPAIILHSNPDFQTIKRPRNLFAYFVRRSPNVFSTIRVFAEELLDLEFTATNLTGPTPNSDNN